VALYFSSCSGTPIEAALHFTAEGGDGRVGGSATTIDGMINTRTNGSSWAVMQGLPPIGEWELSLPTNGEMRKRFADGSIEDILLVITYSGRTPKWSV
jgi:hypothetical protein